jgi:heme/copper-type cytochrome/quinol oxidase subunit 2
MDANIAEAVYQGSMRAFREIISLYFTSVIMLAIILVILVTLIAFVKWAYRRRDARRQANTLTDVTPRVAYRNPLPPFIGPRSYLRK